MFDPLLSAVNMGAHLFFFFEENSKYVGLNLKSTGARERVEVKPLGSASNAPLIFGLFFRRVNEKIVNEAQNCDKLSGRARAYVKFSN